MSWIELNATDPAPPAGAQNVHFREDSTHLGTQSDPLPVSAYLSPFRGDSGSGGASGIVPAPAAGDAAAGKVLKADGTWYVPPTIAGVQQESYTYAADTGAANAYVVALTPAPTLVAGSKVVFKAVHANTGASTLAVNGGSAVAITKQGSTALASGDIAAGQIITVIYDGTQFQMTAGASGGSGSGMTNPMTTQGDIIVGGASGAPQRLAAGSAGQVLTSNGPGAPPSYQAGGGGGSVVSITLFPGVAVNPTIAGTGLTTPFNQKSTFSASNTPNGISLTDTTSNGGVEHIEAIVQPYPATPFTATAVFTVPVSANYNLAGIIITSDLSTGKIQCAVNRWGPAWAVMNYNSFNSFNGFLYGPANFAASLVGVRVQDDGTNIVYYFSNDGIVWDLVSSQAKSSSFLGASGFKYLGLILDPVGSALQVVCLAWNITYP